MRRCWTCNQDHDLDMACPSSPAARSRRAAGELDDFTADGLFDDAPGPVITKKTMTAGFDTECPRCDGAVFAGQTIAPTPDGWVHEECATDD
jgi:hypothetical protein